MTNASIRRGTKSTIDFYQTPAWATQALIDKHIFFNNSIYEPCCGSGAISKVFESNGFTVKGSDLRDDPEVYGARGIDATDYNFRAQFENKTVVTNPPFSCAEQMIKHWLTFGAEEIIILHRLNFLETSARSRWLMNEAPLKNVYVFGDRANLYDENDPDYLTGDKVYKETGSAVAYAWFVFWPHDPDINERPRLDWIHKNDK